MKTDTNTLSGNKVERHKNICDKLNKVYEAKNHDYGDSFGETYKKLGIISAVTRLSDKYNRLVSLATSQDYLVKDESISDTLLDMANYAIMTYMELENETGYIEVGEKLEDMLDECNDKGDTITTTHNIHVTSYKDYADR